MPKSTVKCQVCVKVSSLISFLGCGCHPFGGECPNGGRGRTNSRILMEMRRVWKAMRKPMSTAMRWGLRSGCLAAIRKKGKKQRAARSDSRPPIKPIDRLFHSASSWSLLAIGSKHWAFRWEVSQNICLFHSVPSWSLIAIGSKHWAFRWEVSQNIWLFHSAPSWSLLAIGSKHFNGR